MRTECPDCIIYRSFPDHKGDCGKHCILEYSDEELTKDLDEYNERIKKEMIADGTWLPEMDK